MNCFPSNREEILKTMKSDQKYSSLNVNDCSDTLPSGTFNKVCRTTLKKMCNENKTIKKLVLRIPKMKAILRKHQTINIDNILAMSELNIGPKIHNIKSRETKKNHNQLYYYMESFDSDLHNFVTKLYTIDKLNNFHFLNQYVSIIEKMVQNNYIHIDLTFKNIVINYDSNEEVITKLRLIDFDYLSLVHLPNITELQKDAFIIYHLCTFLHYAQKYSKVNINTLFTQFVQVLNKKKQDFEVHYFLVHPTKRNNRRNSNHLIFEQFKECQYQHENIKFLKKMSTNIAHYFEDKFINFDRFLQF